MSPSGFYHAPVSKGLMAVAAAGTLLTQTMKWSSLGLSHAALFEKLQLWRVGTCHVAFGTAGEAVFGLFLLYHFRMFERQRGTHKYAALAFTCTCAATSMQLAWLLLSPSKGQTLASGPYGLLFALLVQYAYDVPAGSFFSVLGCRFSDKTFMYLLALQLVFSSSTAAAVPSLSGAVAGLLYRADFMRMRRFQFPKSVCRFLSTTLGTLLASPKPGHPGQGAPANRRRPSPHAAVRPQGGEEAQGYQDQMLPPLHPGDDMDEMDDMDGMVGMGAMGGMGAGAMGEVPVDPQPSEEAMEALVSMGFDRNAARIALIQAHNNVNVATHLLLGGGAV
mmetsp:Transcript_23469/g.44706  ORF Transcript_23469/g.44706 Transcript_23469/m.44706 type:complete len:334 (+) Transcript_23469:98-1099(+)